MYEENSMPDWVMSKKKMGFSSLKGIEEEIISSQNIYARKRDVYIDELETSLYQLQDRIAQMESESTDELDKLNRHYADYLELAVNLIELERFERNEITERFKEHLDEIQKRKVPMLAELHDFFKRRLTTVISCKEQKIFQLQADKETLLEKCSRLRTVEKLLEQNSVELDKTKKELNLLRIAKDNRNQKHQKQKINELKKVRLENDKLKKQMA
ncbi:hypothetical protein COOONC_13164 [Cooperia oncophora]